MCLLAGEGLGIFFPMSSISILALSSLLLTLLIRCFVAILNGGFFSYSLTLSILGIYLCINIINFLMNKYYYLVTQYYGLTLFIFIVSNKKEGMIIFLIYLYDYIYITMNKMYPK